MDLTHIKDIRHGMKNINVIFIILEMGHPTRTKENREVRSCKVADTTASINVSIWDTPGQYLVPGDIVRITKAYATTWQNCLTLYTGKNGEIHKVGEFCMAFNELPNMSEPQSISYQILGSQQFPGTGGSNGGTNGNGPGGNGHGKNGRNSGQPLQNSSVTPPVGGNGGGGQMNSISKHSPVNGNQGIPVGINSVRGPPVVTAIRNGGGPIRTDRR